MSIEWRDHGTSNEGVTTRGFEIAGPRDTIYGNLWTPSNASGPLPLVLIGHGGGGSKAVETVVANARGFVTEHGLAAAAIDAPGHGERGGVQGRTPEYYALWADGTIMTDNATADWQLTLTTLLATGLFDADRVARFQQNVVCSAAFGLPHTQFNDGRFLLVWSTALP